MPRKSKLTEIVEQLTGVKNGTVSKMPIPPEVLQDLTDNYRIEYEQITSAPSFLGGTQKFPVSDWPVYGFFLKKNDERGSQENRYLIMFVEQRELKRHNIDGLMAGLSLPAFVENIIKGYNLLKGTKYKQ